MATKPKARPATNATGAALHCPGIGPLERGATVFIGERLAASDSVKELADGGSLRIGDLTTEITDGQFVVEIPEPPAPTTPSEPDGADDPDQKG